MFAARVLMPMCVIKECKAYTVVTIASLCGVSLTAATFRAERLQILLKRNKFYTSALEVKLVKQFKMFIKEHNTQKQGQGAFYGAANDNRFTFYNKFLPEMLQINDFIQSKINNPSPAAPLQQETSAADELRKYKQLLDDGIITQEDFDAKKKQLLGL